MSKHFTTVLICSFSFMMYAQKRPNVVIFMADDLGADDLGAYGDPYVRTPHIDKFAREALLFTNAFASSPTCSPSRASFLTGMMPFRNGAHANHSGIAKGINTLPHYMKDMGYRCAIAGKYHIGPKASYPFEMIHGTNVAEQGHEKDGVLWTDLRLAPVEQWISKKKKSDKKPFLLVVNDHSPHVFWPETPVYDADSIQVPEMHIDTKETLGSRARYYTDISKMDNNFGELMKILEQHKLTENTIVIFTSDQGPQWPFGKWSLYDYGIKVPLLIKWPTKINGGTETDLLVSLVDVLPTVIDVVGGRSPKVLSAIDGKSFSKFLKGSRCEHRKYVMASHTGDGKMNRSPIRMIRTKRYKYILNLAPEIKYTTHIDKSGNKGEGGEFWPSWQKKSFSDERAASLVYRYHYHPKEEFYDLANDPDESKNLVFHPQYGNLLQEFRKEMKDWRESQGDFEEGPYQAKSGRPEHIPYIFK